MTKGSLRALSKGYAQGTYTLEEYRRQRTELIDAIVAGEAPIVKYEAPPPPPAEPATTEIPRTERPSAAEPSGPPVKLIAGAAGLIVIAVVAAVVLWPKGEPPESRPATAPAPQIVETPPEPTAVELLINGFLEADDWQTETLQSFRAKWDALGVIDPAAAADSESYRRFADAIYAQIVEEQAAADVGHEAAVDQQHALLELAQLLGIEDQRLGSAAQTLAEEAGVEGTPPSGPEVHKADADSIPVAPAPVAVAPPAKEMEADTAQTVIPESATSPAEPAVSAESPPKLEVAQADIQAQVEAETMPPPSTAESAAEIEPEATGAATPDAAATDSGQSPQPAGAATTAAAAAAATAAAASAPKTEASRGGDTGAASKTPTTTEPATTAAKTPKKRRGCHVGLLKSRRPYCRDRLKSGSGGPTLVVLPAGEFTMGGSKAEEEPQRKVRIGYSFAMSINEISVSEYQLFCKATKRSCPEQPWDGDDYPVVLVSWNDAVAYAEWLSKQTGRRYRLPTEAEWEYGARAGTTSSYPFGDELLPTHARFTYATAPDSPLPQSDKSINRNKFRLYHMVGNVREWVADTWSNSYAGAPTDGSARIDSGAAEHVIRGGSFQDGADALRSAARTHQPAGAADTVTGFRVVQEIETTAESAASTILDDAAWLSAQSPSNLTVQLFAVKQLDRVRELIAAHPELEIRIIPVVGTSVRYRIVHGVFHTNVEAGHAFASLPKDIADHSRPPVIKTFGELHQQQMTLAN